MANLFSLSLPKADIFFFNPEFSFFKTLEKESFFYVKVDFSRKSSKNGYKPDVIRV